MPYIEGETLRDKLDRETQLGIDEAVRITGEVADALDYAHRHGVIHRDIKPENILLHDGRPMVADFGIALAVSAAAGGRMTETGLSLGTPHYMSPEQATADKDLTARSDIYSLGSVLYEMLTGNPPHVGASAQQIIMKIVTEEAAPVTKARKSVPPNVAAAVATALEKLPADRFATAAEFAAALSDARTTSRRTMTGMRTAVTSVSRRVVFGALALAVVGTGFGMWGFLGRPEVPARESVAFTVSGTGVTTPNYSGVTRPAVAISPDGSQIAYSGLREGRRVLVVREIRKLDARVLEGTEDALDPLFSPDGREILFRQGTTLQRVSLRGTPPVKVADVGPSPSIYGLVWLPSGMIYYLIEASHSLFRVPSDGNAPPIEAPLPDSLGLLSELNAVPGEDWLLASVIRETGSGRVVAISTTSGDVRDINASGVGARVTKDGRYILLGKPNGVLTIAAFDRNRLQLVGREVPVLQDIQFTVIGLPTLSVSATGTLVYLTGSERDRTVVEVTRQGRERLLPLEPSEYKDPRWSPDGTRIAVEIVDGISGDIWIHDTRSGTSTRLTNGSQNLYPIWTPDGSRLVFTSRRAGLAGLWTQRVDGGGDAEQIQPGADSALRFPHAITPDGRTLLFRTNTATNGMDIGAIPLDGSGGPTDVLVTPDNEGSPTISPDGRWMAYISDASGVNEVYITPWPDVGRRAQVSSGGGTEPQWNPQGGELFYRTGDALVAAALTERNALLVPTTRDTLFTGSYFQQPRWPEYDVSADGQRFLMLKRGTAREELVVITNWVDRAIAQIEEQEAAR